MKRQRVCLWTQEEYTYPAAGGFLPFVDAFLHEDSRIRPAVVIAPGGGYRRCAPREGACVARRFYELGYQAFVCAYTTNPLELHPLEKQPLTDLARAVRLLRCKAAQWKLDPGRIAVCGFSAGGHLAASLGVHWRDFEESHISCKPDAMILCYPVISVFSDIAHGASGTNLLGVHPSEEAVRYMQLDRHVRPDCPPVLLWHTLTDRTVPVQNSRCFAEACRAAGVKYELHLFSSGDHGLSLADGSAVIGESSDLDTLSQTAAVLDALARRELTPDQETAKLFLSRPEVRLLQTQGESAGVLPLNEEVKNWVDLAHQWLCKLADDPQR